MIDSEIVVGTGLRITVAKDELAAKLAVVARGVSTRTTVLVLGGIQLRAEGGRLHLAATDMEVSLRSVVDAQVAGEGTVVVPGRLLLDIARSLPDARGDDRAPPRRGRRRRDRRHARPTGCTRTRAEDFPRLPDVDAASLHTIDRDALVETIARVGRSASRDESRPVLTGHPRPLRAGQGRDGRHRLVPPRRQGDAGRRDAARPRGDHPGPRAAGARPDRRRRRRGAARHAREPRRVRRGRHVADDAPHRRPVPELPPAAARSSSSTSCRCRARSCSRSSAASR